MDVMRRLEGRRALVTGSGTGIGRSTVLRLTAEGAAAIVNYVGPSDPADEAGGVRQVELALHGDDLDVLADALTLEYGGSHER